ncbi:MAG: YdcF family protein [Lachnospiraceae bacterium]|nr:YdcF family protein [Lachnospiraceae bacterium]MDD6448702.1 YdcF family protein [Lachnospiraceae bacterium]MDD6451923.1 YdcF family protein [Lachnospiraceae bacterium]MDD6578637.1 YdcF family protein [Lachnospiraceae bacterium]
MLFILYLIFGTICILYGILIGSARSGTGFFLVWLLVGGLFLFHGFALHFHWLDRIPIWLRRTNRILLVCLVFLISTGMVCIFSGFRPPSGTEADTIIVLGAQVRGSEPSRVLLHRLETAESYLKEHPKTKCIVSGGQGSNEALPEATVMKNWLLDRGISKTRIQAETRSRNTNENLLFSQRLLDPNADRVFIVTSNFHVFRSVKLAEKQGYRKVSGLPAPTESLYLPNNIFRESLAIIKDKLVGHI